MFFKFEGTLAALSPTCLWTFLINTFRFSIGLFVLKKKKKKKRRAREEIRHPGRVGIRSKVWHAAQRNHRYSPAFHLSFLSLLTTVSLLLQHSHTLFAGLQQTVWHIHSYVFFVPGVVTSLDNAALCLFFRREEGRNALTERGCLLFTLFRDIHAHLGRHTELFVSFRHANNWGLCEAMHDLSIPDR